MTPPQKQKSTKQPSNWLILLAGVIILIILAIAARFSPNASTAAGIDPTLPAGAVKQFGFVKTLPLSEAATINLFAEPDSKAKIIGRLPPDQSGTLLAQDASGEWLYVRFGDQSGWAPFIFFHVTMAQ